METIPWRLNHHWSPVQYCPPPALLGPEWWVWAPSTQIVRKQMVCIPAMSCLCHPTKLDILPQNLGSNPLLSSPSSAHSNYPPPHCQTLPSWTPPPFDFQRLCLLRNFEHRPDRLAESEPSLGSIRRWLRFGQSPVPCIRRKPFRIE